MSRSRSEPSVSDARLDQILREVSREVFGPDEDVQGLDFATIEQRSHEVGQRVARRLLEEAATKQADNFHDPQPCPDCQRPCQGTLTARDLVTQDGTIELQEATYTCPHCRRVFFPQSMYPTSESPPIQPQGPR